MRMGTWGDILKMICFMAMHRVKDIADVFAIGGPVGIGTGGPFCTLPSLLHQPRRPFLVPVAGAIRHEKL